MFISSTLTQWKRTSKTGTCFNTPSGVYSKRLNSKFYRQITLSNEKISVKAEAHANEIQPLYEFRLIQNNKYPSINEAILLWSVILKSYSKYLSINEAILQPVTLKNDYHNHRLNRPTRTVSSFYTAQWWRTSTCTMLETCIRRSSLLISGLDLLLRHNSMWIAQDQIRFIT